MEEFPASKVHLSTTCNRTYCEVSQQTSREPGSRAKWGGGGGGGGGGEKGGGPGGGGGGGGDGTTIRNWVGTEVSDK